MKVAHKTFSKKVQFNLSINFFVSIFTLDWLRLNCIEIFHYLTNQLKGTPIFENDHRKIDINKESSTVFNDFDFQPHKLLSSTHNNTVFVAISNKEYMENVYNIATVGFKELPITQKVLEIYEVRQREEWEGPDSVYHA